MAYDDMDDEEIVLNEEEDEELKDPEEGEGEDY